MKTIKPEIETLVQLVVCLLQIVSLFLVKPDMFNFYEQGSSMPAGDPGFIIVFFISVILLFLCTRFSAQRFFRSWLLTTIISGLLLAGCYVWYNHEIRQKTFLCTSPDLPPLRIIKGDHYVPEIMRTCDVLKDHPEKVSECDVIAACISYENRGSIAEIWPADEITSNTERLLLDYYICLILATTLLVSGVQLLKCKRNE